MKRSTLVVAALAVAAAAAILAASLYLGGHGGELVVRDLSGRSVTLREPARRAIVMSVSELEIVHLLGADGQVAGVPAEARLDPLLPPGLREKPVVGSRLKIGDWEKVLSLKADLIVDLDLEAFYDVKGMVARAEGYGIPVLLIREDSISDLYAAVDLLGKAFGREAEARRLNSFLRQQFAEAGRIGASIPPESRLRVVMIQPIFGKLYLVNGNDVLAEAARLVGARYMVNVTLRGYTPVRVPMDRERIVASYRDADAIILLTSTVTPLEKVEEFRRDMMADPVWRQVKAVREGRVYVLRADLGSDSWLRWSPRLAVGVWQLGHTLYPERFPDWRGKAGELLSMYRGVGG